MVVDVGEIWIEMLIEYMGELKMIMFDFWFVMDFLKVLDDLKMVELEIENDELVVLFWIDDGYVYVIMLFLCDWIWFGV